MVALAGTVPSSAIARTLQRIFVVRIRNGQTDWTDVKTGANSGNLTEVFGDLREGDLVATRGTDEIKPGTAVKTQEGSGKTPVGVEEQFLINKA